MTIGVNTKNVYANRFIKLKIPVKILTYYKD